MEERISAVMAKLAADPFRARFQLDERDRDYLDRHGLTEVIEHGRKLLSQRLAPAVVPNDGRQTPWRGHPIFVAQHATATCCRGCLRKWHGIPKGREMSAEELDYVLSVLAAWLGNYSSPTGSEPARIPRQLNVFETG